MLFRGWCKVVDVAKSSHFRCLCIDIRAASVEKSAECAKPILNFKPKSSVVRSRSSFVDFKRVRTRGGRGGNGCCSFLALWCNPFAGPDGGDAGNGGHVIFQGDLNTKSLSHLRYSCRAERGVDGRGDNCSGANADHLYIKVPLCTTFKDTNSGKLLGEITKDGQLFVAARGGCGGKGNRFFMTNENQAPSKAEEGAEGEDRVYDVEMRIIAHAGLIGFPNAGKSSLLRAISRASPKVAYYPFTTLNPSIGMVQFSDYSQLAVADIPGLISGASENRGLGFAFLRHIERCLCLFYVIDLSLGDPWEQLEELRFELEQFRPGLSSRPSAIIGNKIDLPQSEASLRLFLKRTDLPIFPVSAKERRGLEPLLVHFRRLYEKHKGEWQKF